MLNAGMSLQREVCNLKQQHRSSRSGGSHCVHFVRFPSVCVSPTIRVNKKLDLTNCAHSIFAMACITERERESVTESVYDGEP